MPGDKVLDFMAGTGSVIPACHELKLSCTAIELEAEYYGRMLERVQGLK
jgi:DNA modification methylase